MPFTDILNADQLKQALNSGNPQEQTQTIESLLNVLFTLPAGIVKTMVEKEVKKYLPSFDVTVNIGDFKGKKAVQVIISPKEP